MDATTMERAKAAMIGEDGAKEIGRNALHGARVLIDRANATGIEERRDEYQEHAADLMATADLARTVLVLHADLARLRAEHAAALDAARREGAEGMRAAAVDHCRRVTNRAGFFRHIVDHVGQILDARESETTVEAAQRVTRELAVLRAQQAPLVACVDALRSAARDAGWRDADATGETLVAWVRRGEREACARIARAHVGQQGMRAPAPQWVDVGERIAAQIEERSE